MKRLTLFLLMLTAPYASAELLPADVTENELTRNVNWCGALRETARSGGNVWFIYDSMPLRGAAPTMASCEKLYANPNRFSGGAFILQRPAASVSDWLFSNFSQPPEISGCQLLGVHSGKVAGFIEYQGVRLPYLEAMQYPQQCVPLAAE